MKLSAQRDFTGEWRGPGSNRRHHGFQPCGSDDCG